MLEGVRYEEFASEDFHTSLLYQGIANACWKKMRRIHEHEGQLYQHKFPVWIL
jgi:hypothetical protein